MKRYCACLGVYFLILIIMLTGCDETPPVPKGTPALSTPIESDLAPPYEEIKQRVNTIIADAVANYTPPPYHVPHRDLPLVQKREMDDFLAHVEGKKVRGWRGWAAIIDTGGPPDAPPKYSVFIYMVKPEIGGDYQHNVDIFDVPSEQVQKLWLWKDGYKPDGPWQQVIFSGTVYGVTLDGQVNIDNPQIEPLD